MANFFASLFTDIESSPIATIILNKAFGSSEGKTLGADATNVLGLVNDYAAIKTAQSSGQSPEVISQQVSAAAADAVGQIASAVHLNANLTSNPNATPTAAEGVNEILLLGAKQIASAYATQAVATHIAQGQSVPAVNVAATVESKIVDQANQQQNGADTGKNPGNSSAA